jgi:hypothetical protein
MVMSTHARTGSRDSRKIIVEAIGVDGIENLVMALVFGCTRPQSLLMQPQGFRLNFEREQSTSFFSLCIIDFF